MQIREFAVAVAELSVDATPPNRMTRIMRIGHGKAFQDAELRFHRVKPGGFGRCPDGWDPQSSQQSQETGMIVDVTPVVQITNRRFRG